MALIQSTSASSSSGVTSKPDKMITASGANTTIYTCPAGRKFIGEATSGSSQTHNMYAGNASWYGSYATGNTPMKVYLNAGESFRANQYSAYLSGIESDA